MIVISGALVLVALVLLVVGVVGPSLGFVYASIAVSLVSLVFLVIGILQRRGEPLPAAEVTTGTPEPARASGDDDATPVTAVTPVPAPREPVPPVAETVAEEPAVAGTVLVVSGRPRYHVEGCRYLTGKAAEEVDVLDARDEGFTPCGVCKPDEALAVADPAVAEPVYDDEPVELEEIEPEVEPEPEVVEPVTAALPNRRAAAKKATSARRPAARAATREMPADLPTGPVEEAEALDSLRDQAAAEDVAPEEVAPAPRSRARKATEPAAPAKAAAARKAPAKAPAKAARKAPAKAPSRAAAAAVDSTPATAAAKRTGQVVVIPERGRFHRSECRYVRGVDGAELLTKAQATRQGFEACGVCKP